MTDLNHGVITGTIKGIYPKDNSTAISVLVNADYKGEDGKWVNKSYLLFFTAFGGRAKHIAGSNKSGEPNFSVGDWVALEYYISTGAKPEDGGYPPEYKNIVSLTKAPKPFTDNGGGSKKSPVVVTEDDDQDPFGSIL